jgi:hypothetical protein
MSVHLEEMQRNLEWDLVDYSGQAQEHYGKMCKSIIAGQTNHQLSKVKKDGSKSASVVMQMAKNMMYRKHLMSIVPIPATEYSHKKIVKEAAGISAYQMVKADVLPVSQAALSCSKGKHFEATGTPPS